MATIVINYTDKLNDYFTLNDGANDYKWHGRKGVAQNADSVLFLVRKREYPDANVLVSEDVYRPCQTLAEIEAWITANPTVDPLPWTSTHPKEASQEYQDDVTEYKASPLYNKTYAQLDTIIQNKMAGITNIASAKTEIGEMLQIITRTLKSIEKQLIEKDA